MSAAILVILGAILAVSILADAVARRTGLPRVSLLVLVGLVYAMIEQWGLGRAGGDPLGGLAEPLVTVALVMVALLLGGDLTMDRLMRMGRAILAVSLAVVLASAVITGLGLLALGYPPVIALPLAAIALATDPAAVQQTVREAGGAGESGQLLLGIVAIDDAWGIIGFGLAMAILGYIVAADGLGAVAHAGWELGGAILLGLAVGLPAAWLSGRLQPGEPTQAEALAIVLLIAGIATWQEVSALLAAMTAGFVIANLAPHHTRSLSAIENIEWPFLVFFFVLAGATVDLARAGDALGLTLAYILLRLASRLLGGWAGVAFGPAAAGVIPRRIGLALTPQAGVAIGMALLAAETYPEAGPVLIAVAVTSSIVFELAGPLLARRAIIDGGRGNGQE